MTFRWLADGRPLARFYMMTGKCYRFIHMVRYNANGLFTENLDARRRSVEIRKLQLICGYHV